MILQVRKILRTNLLTHQVEPRQKEMFSCVLLFL